MNSSHFTFGISVIICTFNGANRIKPTLKALYCQKINNDYPWEILIIDNGSTDNTIQIVNDFIDKSQKMISVKILLEPNKGKSNALIKGYDEAKYEFMLVCDDDNWLNPNYLSTIIELFTMHPDIGLLGGYGIAEFKNDIKPNWFDKYQACFACGKLHQTSGFLKNGDVSIWGAGSIIKKTVWNYLRSNGFYFINNTGNGNQLGEDLELAHAVYFAGFKLYFDDRLWFYHDMSGGRVTWLNAQNQIKNSGSIMHVVFLMAFKSSINNHKQFNLMYYQMILSLFVNLMKQILVKNNVFSRKHVYYQLKELLLNKKKYHSIYNNVLPWITKFKLNRNK